MSQRRSHSVNVITFLCDPRDIATASIGPRSTIATGPEELQESKWELELDTERFIQAAEVHLALAKD